MVIVLYTRRHPHPTGPLRDNIDIQQVGIKCRQGELCLMGFQVQKNLLQPNNFVESYLAASLLKPTALPFTTSLQESHPESPPISYILGSVVTSSLHEMGSWKMEATSTSPS